RGVLDRHEGGALFRGDVLHQLELVVRDLVRDQRELLAAAGYRGVGRQGFCVVLQREPGPFRVVERRRVGQLGDHRVLGRRLVVGRGGELELGVDGGRRGGFRRGI